MSDDRRATHGRTAEAEPPEGGLVSTIRADGVEIYYEEHGAGKPLLLIHGAAGAGRSFSGLVPLLTEEHRVIVPDLRGLGRSERVAPLERPEVWVEDMARILDAAGADEAIVAGVSLGARIAGRLALANPASVTALVVDAPLIGMTAEASAALNRVLAPVPEDSEQARAWQLLHGDRWREAVAFYFATRSTDTFQEYFTLRPLLSQVTVPTLICRGDRPEVVHPLDDALVWHRDAPRTELWIAPGMSGSSTMHERPREFVEVLRGFRARLVDAPR
jgi:pimeloyl-ACP methyl ester carboxylesterase